MKDTKRSQPTCPRCGSKRCLEAALRRKDGSIFRDFYCRDCRYYTSTTSTEK